jgi:hypothetical protein
MKITTQAQNRVQVRSFEGLKVHAVYGTAPHGTVDAILLGHLQAVEREIEAYDDRIAAARRNKTLSPEGVRDSTAELRGRSADALAVLRVNAQIARDRALANRESLFVAPGLDPSDAAGAALDREIRESFASLSDHQRAVELTKDRNLQALLRSPFDTSHSKAAQGFWRERVTKLRADEIAKFDRDAEIADWLLSAAKAYQIVLDRTQIELGEPKETAGDVSRRLRAEAAS